MKEDALKGLSPLERSYIEDYLDYIRHVELYDVADAVAEGKTVKDYKERAGQGLKLNIAMVKTLIRPYPEVQKRLSKVVTPRLIKYTLKFENPDVYNFLVRIEKLDEWLVQNIRDALTMLGVQPNIINEAIK